MISKIIAYNPKEDWQTKYLSNDIRYKPLMH